MKQPTHQLVNAATNDVVVPRLEVANTYWTRLRGLQFRKSLAPDQGILMERCSSIHTFWMRFSIDVIMLGANGEVLEIRPSISPWRIVLPKAKQVKSILEVPAHTCRCEVGDRLQVVHLATI